MNGSRRHIALIGVLLATAGSASSMFAQEKTTPQVAITAADLRERLYTYAADSMKGREAGTLGNSMATEYLAAQLEAMGLEPAGDEGTYFQTIPLVRRRVDEAAAINVGQATLRLWEDFAPMRPLGSLLPVAPAGSIDGAQAIYAGRVGEGPGELTPERIAGKLVVLGAPLVDGRPSYRFWRAGDPAAYAGAAGIAVTTLDITPRPALRFFAGGWDALDGPQREGALPPVIIISERAAELLLGTTLADAALGDVGEKVRGSFGFRKAPVDYPARNVIAVLPGSDPALRGQYVAISAHNDHVGLSSSGADHDSVWAFNRILRREGAESRPPPRPTPEQMAQVQALRDSLAAIRPPRIDSIYNGADDDGSGTIVVLEIAEAFAGAPAPPKRSMLFIWHTAEEKGLLGAEYYADHPTVARDSIVALINMDMVGRGSAADLEGGGPGYLELIGTRRLSTELGDLIEAVNERGDHGFEPSYQYDAPGHPARYYCRSDHVEYAKYGIPIAFFSTGNHPDYHQLTDEPQYIDYDKMARVARFIMDVVESVANLEHRLVLDKPKPDPNARCEQ